MIKAGIIGLGVGEAHIAGYEAHPNCEVTMLCDFNPEVMKTVGERHPGKQFATDPKDVLTNPDIDVVTIASYDSFHHEQIMMAIAHGKHVFVEKPLCLYREEAEDIHQALNAHPEIQISSNLILRMAERFQDLKKKMEKADLGDVYYIEGAYNYGRLHKIVDGWRGKEKFYSAVYGGGVHLIDLYLWLMDQRVESVFAFGNNIASKASSFSNFDLVASVLQFENGATGRMTVNLASLHPHFHQLDLYGTQGTFQNRMDEALLYKDRGSMQAELLDTAYPGAAKGDLLFDFVDSILERKEPQVSKKAIFDAMAVCFAIEASAHSCVAQKVKYFD